jgi:hypothetical protein
MRYLVRGLFFVALQLSMSQALVPWIGPVCGQIGAAALSWAVLEHVAIDWSLDLIQERRRGILHGLSIALNWLIAQAILLSPLWVPLLLPNKLWLRLGVGLVLGFVVLVFIGSLKEREATGRKAA